MHFYDSPKTPSKLWILFKIGSLLLEPVKTAKTHQNCLNIAVNKKEHNSRSKTPPEMFTTAAKDTYTPARRSTHALIGAPHQALIGAPINMIYTSRGPPLDPLFLMQLCCQDL